MEVKALRGTSDHVGVTAPALGWCTRISHLVMVLSPSVGDAQMPDEVMAPGDEAAGSGNDDFADDDLELTESAMVWVKRNEPFLNAGRLPAGNRPAPSKSEEDQPELWDMAEWETFQRWAYKRIEQLEAKEKELQRTVRTMDHMLSNALATYGSVSAEMRNGLDVMESIISMQTGVELNSPKMSDKIEDRIALLAMDLSRRTTK